MFGHRCSGLAALGLCFVLSLAIGPRPALGAEPDECGVFVRTHSRLVTSDQVINAMTRTSDGGFAVTGYTVRTGSKDVFVAKFDCTGQCKWWTTYGGSGDDEGRGIVETSDGYLIIVGSTRSHNDGADFFMSKRPSNNQWNAWTWTRIWGGGIGQDEELHGIIEATNGDIWVTGYTSSYSSWPAYRPQVVLARLSPDGTTLTGTVAGNPAISREYKGFALAEVFGDYPGFCVVGSISGSAFGQDALLAKFRPTGAFWWADRFGDGGPRDETATSIIRTSNGCLAIAGRVDYSDVYPNNKAGFLVKTDRDAQVAWGRFAAGMSPYYSRYCKSVVETYDEGLVVTGADHSPYMYADRVILSKWDFGGATVWNRGFELGEISIGNAVLEDADHSLLVAGATQGDATGQYDALVGRWCSAGLTCLPDEDGPSWSAWNPGQQRINFPAPDSDEFLAALTAWSVNYASLAHVSSTICEPTIHTVHPDGSGDYPTIQQAIDAASAGDVIELGNGEFDGPLNRNLGFAGKCLTLRSQSGNPEDCVIDCENADRGFNFGPGDTAVQVEGITIKRGSAMQGGGVYCNGASPVFRNCVIDSCNADNGAGVFVTEGSPQLTSCVVKNCGFQSGGNAIELWGDLGTTIAWSQIVHNNGDGIAIRGDGNHAISQCTVANNGVSGVSVMLSSVVLENTILWGNWASVTIHQTEPPSSFVQVDCSDVEGGWSGPGDNNIDLDPLFYNPSAGEYRLHPNSPCSPANQPACRLIGALGVFGDFTGDGRVDFGDFAILPDCMAGPGVLDPLPGCDPGTFTLCDLDGDGDVDLTDFAAFHELFGN